MFNGFWDFDGQSQQSLFQDKVQYIFQISVSSALISFTNRCSSAQKVGLKWILLFLGHNVICSFWNSQGEAKFGTQWLAYLSILLQLVKWSDGCHDLDWKASFSPYASGSLGHQFSVTSLFSGWRAAASGYKSWLVHKYCLWLHHIKIFTFISTRLYFFVWWTEMKGILVVTQF